VAGPPPLSARLPAEAGLVFLYIAGLAFRLTPGAAHEALGLGLAGLAAVHGYHNRAYFRTVRKLRRLTWGRLLNLLTIAALGLGLVIVTVTGILNSRHIFGLSGHFEGSALRRIHVLAAWWGLVLMGIHCGLRWKMVRACLRRARTWTAFSWSMIRLSVLLTAAYGLWSFADRDLISKLFLGYTFDFWDPQRPKILFFTETLSAAGLIASLAYYLQKALAALAAKPPRPG
jgi:hypothetical protein